MTAREPWFEALGVARELRDSLDDPRRGEWGGYPWEHLGDAERDVRVLLAGIEAITNAEAVARAFHETYERLAPWFGYETREASAVPWEDVPEQNKRLMVAVAAVVLRPANSHPGPRP